MYSVKWQFETRGERYISTSTRDRQVLHEFLPALSLGTSMQQCVRPVVVLSDFCQRFAAVIVKKTLSGVI